MSGLKLHAQTSFYANAVEFWLVDEQGEKRSFGISVTMETEPQDFGSLKPPTFCVPLNNAQELFEQLWAQGFRSAHDKGNSDALDAARKEHLADLRKAAKLG